jgi:hypothetical protein
MLEIHRGDSDVREQEELTLDVRRDCDTEYLRRAEGFIRHAVSGHHTSPGYWEGPYFAGGEGTSVLRASFDGPDTSPRGWPATRSCT